jgi:hypothetical protein
MKTEFFLDLIFIQDQLPQEDFVTAVESQLDDLFASKGHWRIEIKQEHTVSIIVAEVKGIWSLGNEDKVFGHLEKEASPEFWQWLHGYQLEFDAKPYAACSHCGNG